MATITIEEAQAKLSEIIHRMQPGEEVVITEDDRPVARLATAKAAGAPKPRQPGTLRGTVLYMAPDFDAPLEDFKEYME
jgi:prevent-host-death family protein